MRLHHHLKNAFIPHAGNDYHPHALRRHWLHFYGGVLVTVKVLTVVFVSSYAGLARPSSITTGAIIQQTNHARVQNGLLGLKENAVLDKAAVSKANDMLRQQYFAHISPTKVTPWYWFRQAGYSYSYAGENLAIDYLQSEDVIQAWLNSPSHRRNLLSSRFKEIGVAVAQGKMDGVDSLLVVQMFGTPTPKQIVKKTTAPVQTPPPAKVAAKPKPATPVTKPPAPPAGSSVLGETIAPTPPAIPTITSPGVSTVVRTALPTITGRAEAGSIIRVAVDTAVVAQGTVASDGVYAIIPDAPLSEGKHTLSVTSEARGIVQATAASAAIDVDTLPPSFLRDHSFALTSLHLNNAYDVWISTTPDVTGVVCRCADAGSAMTKIGQLYQGQIRLDPKKSHSDILQVAVHDGAGNESTATLVDANLFSTGVAAAPAGPASRALRLLFFSRSFFSLFLVLMLIGITVNLSMNWKRQHHPALLGSLLLVYITGALLLL